MDCPKCAAGLAEVYVEPGVLVDRCPTCGGLWLDKGEILHFSPRPAHLGRALQAAAAAASWTGLRCPRCAGELVEVGVEGVRLERCRKCEGIWSDAGELDRLAGGGFTRMAAARETRQAAGAPALTFGASALPSLGLRAVTVMVLLYGLVALAVVTAVQVFAAPPGLAVLIGIGVVLLQYLLGPPLMDFFLRRFQSGRFVERDELPPHLVAFVDRVCGAHRLSFPRFGIIEDGAPNAFTYGHHPGNARVILTRGLLELLDEREREAVVAHELGHVKHWDVVVMTIAGLAPLVLYWIYRALIEVDGKNRGKARAVALGAYLLYAVSQYLVLWLSRTREYHADRFAAEASGDPNALASALVKVAYGLAGRTEPGSAARPARQAGALRAFGIFDPQAALALTASSAATTGFSRENLLAAMQWDLWNPWAGYFELHSTHPLPARRLQHLGALAVRAGKAPLAVFDRRRPESFWDEFLVDLFVRALPPLAGGATLLALLVGGRAPAASVGLALAATGLAHLLRTWFSYRAPQGYPEFTAAALLRRVKVSPVRGVACSVRGTIVGRGVPGLIVSEDLVLRDETGLMLLDYVQPLRVMEWLFGLFRVRAIVGREAVVSGWYRRGPVPYIEMRRIEVTGGPVHRSYVRPMKVVLGVALVVLGLWITTVRL